MLIVEECHIKFYITSTTQCRLCVLSLEHFDDNCQLYGYMFVVFQDEQTELKTPIACVPRILLTKSTCAEIAMPAACLCTLPYLVHGFVEHIISSSISASSFAA